MNVLVAVLSPVQAWTLPRRFVDQLRRDFPQHRFLEAWDNEALRRALPEADAAFAASLAGVDAATLPRLRWIQAAAAGVRHLLSPDVVASPIAVTSARGVRARPIAEHIMAVTLALARQLHVAIQAQAAREWALERIEGSGAVRTLHGRTLGIVGLGAIGQELAPLAAAFGMRVVATRRRVTAPPPAAVAHVWPAADLPRLLAASDVVVLSTALTDATKHLINAETLALLKPGACLINVGRGPLIDDEALVAALRDGRVGGAALDVFVTEPLDRASPYWSLPNVIVTPHVSGTMEDYWTPLVALFSDNLARFEAGQPLRNQVDKAAGY